MVFQRVLWVGLRMSMYVREWQGLQFLLFPQNDSLSSVAIMLNLEPWKVSSYWAFLGSTLCLFHSLKFWDQVLNLLWAAY